MASEDVLIRSTTFNIFLGFEKRGGGAALKERH